MAAAGMACRRAHEDHSTQDQAAVRECLSDRAQFVQGTNAARRLGASRATVMRRQDGRPAAESLPNFTRGPDKMENDVLFFLPDLKLDLAPHYATKLSFS